MTDATRPLSPSTLAVTAGRPVRVAGAPLNVPPTFTSTYVQGEGAVYGRFDNPGWAALEDAVGQLEGGRAVAFASGLAAVAAVLDEVPVGGTVVAPLGSYSGTLNALQRGQDGGRFGEVRLVDPADTAAVLGVLGGADLLWLESPTNPLLAVADLPALVSAAHHRGIPVAVDATFCTPLVLQPLALGADWVVHSATKYLAGHSDALLGIAASADPERADRLRSTRTALGATPGTMEAFLALRGLRTLHLRVERSQANAAVLAERLSARGFVVRYPGLVGDPGHVRAKDQMRGFGSIVCVDLPDAETAERFVDACRLWTPATSLGGVESTLERRRRHSGESLDVPVGLVRLSVGVEDVEDLWADVDQALTGLSGRG